MIKPRKSKKARQMKTEEIAKKVFPKQVLEKLKQVVDSLVKTGKS